MTRFAEVEQYLNEHGFAKVKTGKKHVFYNGRDRISVMKSTEISRKNFEKIQKQVTKSSVAAAAEELATENAGSLSDLLLDSFRKVIATCSKHSGTPMTISSFMAATGLPLHRLTAVINTASQHQDIDTLFSLKTALQKVSIEPKALKDALQKLDGMTSPTTTSDEIEEAAASNEELSENDNEVEETMEEGKEEESTSAVIVKRATREDHHSVLYPWHHKQVTPSNGPKIIIPIVKPKEEQPMETASETQPARPEPVQPLASVSPQARTIPVRQQGFSTKQQAILEIASILGQFPNLEDSEYREITNFAVDFMKFNRH